MKVTMQWFGGSSYGLPESNDVLHFPSIKGAVIEFKLIGQGSWHKPNNRTPCVTVDTPENGGATALLWLGEYLDDVTDTYPDREIVYGRRGGLKVLRV